jgi:PadR family transcriptional regulator PadR
MFQPSAALLDACVLAVVNHEDSYGYQLTQEVRNVFDVSESTLYPVLRRLQSGSLLTTYDQPFNGRNRRYYRITSSGKSQLEIFKQAWRDYRLRIDKVLLNADNNTGGKS